MSRSRHHHAFAGLPTKDKARFHDADNCEDRAHVEARAKECLSSGIWPKFSDRNGRAINRVLLGRVRRDQ